MKKLVMLLTVLAFVQTAAAQNADDYRGGWKTDAAEPHTYEFSIRGDQVRGIYCTHCSDATTLAFVDGKLGVEGITFVVTHVKADGSTSYLDHATAKFDNGNLIVTGTSGAPGEGKFQWTLSKDSRGPDALGVPVSRLPPGPPVPAITRGGGGGGAVAPAAPVAAPGSAAPAAGGPAGAPLGAPPAGGGGRGGQPAYVPPAPWKQLSAADVVGVWLGFGAGMNKQFFIIRRVGNKLRGMVCGRCDNPYTMAALDDFEIQGDTLTFNILHEDWGPGSLPFHNQVIAHIAKNENANRHATGQHAAASTRSGRRRRIADGARSRSRPRREMTEGQFMGREPLASRPAFRDLIHGEVRSSLFSM